ncbi:similar to potassium channel-interacting protein 4 isoform 4-related [Schistosoma mansoni]|uniref:similar to potassium channel-interacting protein 4 isoform 4-related n=1 Tax=Schistosoma mansoni TaxID=6183 RepID=UPI0001A61742|nr:similar to potassium channel-interacting protein 4 isoform 4-related [Schistosoma mansoni]|eukprot:XP_018645382.1 similar to potassium channel-interacting protein 4 isoform 4-related [Schistosoma mansoni]
MVGFKDEYTLYSLTDLTSYAVKSLDIQTKPISIHKLEMMTNFTRKELQLLYQGFKHICPSGVASKESFIGVYRRFFPNREIALMFNAGIDLLLPSRNNSELA